MARFTAVMLTITSTLIFAVCAQAQQRLNLPEMPPANALSVYTSPTTHSIPTASCNPHCDHTPGYAEGDWYLVQETIPPSLDQASASLICEGIGCPFDRYVITIDNPGHIAT